MLCQVYCGDVAGCSLGSCVVSAGGQDVTSQACFHYVSACTGRQC
jgi:hypothetical protein